MGYLGLSAVRKIARLPRKAVTQRFGICWSLDLDEAIDLTIYVFGRFEWSTIRAYKKYISPGSTVVDVGANIGAHTLPLARCVGSTGRVLAFEPTAYAFEKLSVNIGLNPELKSRIEPHRALLLSSSQQKAPGELWSSWPLDDQSGTDAEVCGKPMPVGDAAVYALDEFLEKNHPGVKIDLMKIDVDGFEGEVISGARGVIEKYHPVLVLEFSPYQFDKKGESFEDFVNFLSKAGYRFREVGKTREWPRDAALLRLGIPVGSSRNMVLTHNF